MLSVNYFTSFLLLLSHHSCLNILFFED